MGLKKQMELYKGWLRYLEEEVCQNLDTTILNIPLGRCSAPPTSRSLANQLSGEKNERDQGYQQLSRGYGFVTYMNREDR